MTYLCIIKNQLKQQSVMKQEEILEGNKLIAFFMGATPCKDWQGFDGFEHPDWYHTQWSNRYQENLELYSYRYSELSYNSSYDWLMPVVEKIESLVFPNDVYYNFNILGGCQVYIISSDIDEFGSYSEPTKLLTIFKACVEFVKWYNKKQEK